MCYVLETGYSPLVVIFYLKLSHLNLILKVLYLEHQGHIQLVEAVARLTWQTSKERSE